MLRMGWLTILAPLLRASSPALRNYPSSPGRRIRFLVGGVAGAGIAVFAPVSVSAGLPGPAPASWDGWRPSVEGDVRASLQDAVTLGQEGGLPLHLCRGAINGDIHVGRIRPDFGGCHIGYAGREVEVTPYEVLTLPWKSSGNVTPVNVFGAGEELAASPEARFDSVRLYLCRAAYEGGIHPGQARAGEKGCAFGFGGGQVVAQTYDLLEAAPWMTWTGAVARDLPDTAVVSGNEGGEAFFACRAADRNGVHPGKIKKSSLGCSIVSDGREAIVERFEILVTRWSIASAGTAPVSAYPAGWEKGTIQFVCRVQNRTAVQIGKVNEGLGGCHVGMQGREVVFTEYEVLAQ